MTAPERPPGSGKPARRRTTLLAAGIAGLVAAGLGVAYTQSAEAATTLGASAAQSGRYFGVAIAASKLGNATYAKLVKTEFNAVTPENEMKWDATEPSPGNFNYTAGDKILAQGQSNGSKIRGHALLWYQQQPSWAKSMSGSALRSAMMNHVTKVATHYKGKI
ncbi:endo-1,4-beta-xylanase, partial [Paractinoplanes ferrugineus]